MLRILTQSGSGNYRLLVRCVCLCGFVCMISCIVNSLELILVVLALVFVIFVGNGIDDSCHILRTCELARDVWDHVISDMSMDLFCAGNLMDWIHRNTLSRGENTDSNWPSMFLAVIWFLWVGRNKILLAHEDVKLAVDDSC